MSLKDAIRKSILQSFTYSQTVNAETALSILLSMFLSLLAGLLIYAVYRKYFQGVLFSRSFAVTLVGMTVLSCMVTLAISTNIVISLGMVGALSIVRYRTAIKEPLDLLYLFWAITTGITLGAGMFFLALVGALFLLTVIRLFVLRFRPRDCYLAVIHTDGAPDLPALQKAFSDLRLACAVKSQVLHGQQAEITIQFSSDEAGLAVAGALQGLPSVLDVTLVQYNGEYHG